VATSGTQQITTAGLTIDFPLTFNGAGGTFRFLDDVNLGSNLQLENGTLNLNDKNVKSVNLVVVTGGEPFRQEISLLCDILLKDNYALQIETNGTIYRTIPKDVEIICSPKVVGGSYLSIREDLLPNISAFKFLISSNIKEYSSVPELGQKKCNIPVFVQAMDEYKEEINIQNLKLAVDIAINNGYRLSYQIHKNLGIE
jgi:organic radical activating enzyme